MIGTYAGVLAVCVAALALGQAAIALCGGRRWSWLSPAVGLGLLGAICWGTVRLPGHGVVSAALALALFLAALVYLRGRVEGGREALRAGWPVAVVALAVTALPFAVEGHFGVLGTGLNPDMSQHLLATYRLAHGEGSQLLRQGYPLGPHAIVVALDKGLGVGLLQGFSGLSVAVAVLAALTALAAFSDLGPLPRTAAALLVGLTYLAASYFAQGAFKEIMQALFLLAFALALREADRAWRDLPLRFVPAALLAVGSAYVYSFPGLTWLAATAVFWVVVGWAWTRFAPPAGGVVAGVPRGAEDALHPSTVGDAATTGPAGRALGPSPIRAALLGLLVFAVLVAPEIGRMVDFQHFETFAPKGPGLGNLFGQLSPFEALGIWPSGDFRLAPGGGAVPAAGYYLGAAFATLLLLYGIAACWRRRERAILAALAAAALAYLVSRLGGTAYTSAKALEIASPLVVLAILLPLSDAWRFSDAYRQKSATAIFVLVAGACSVLALANAPVGPTSYSPALNEFRQEVGEGPTLVLASHELLSKQHGEPFLAWELRGGRVCIAATGEEERLPSGVRFVITQGDRNAPPYPGLRVRRAASPYVLWEATRPVASHSPCPLIAVRQARQGPAR